MFWLITGVLLIVLLFGNIDIKINTIKKNRCFYIIKIYIFSVRVYKTAVILRMRGNISPQLMMVRRTGCRILTNIPKSLEHRHLVKQGKAVDTKFLLKAISAKSGKIEVNLGTGDAASTALLCEEVRILLETALKVVGIKEIRIMSRPNFKKEEFYIDVTCILSTFPAQIIYRYLKQKGGSLIYAPDRKYFKDDDE